MIKILFFSYNFKIKDQEQGGQKNCPNVLQYFFLLKTPKANLSKKKYKVAQVLPAAAQALPAPAQAPPEAPTVVANA